MPKAFRRAAAGSSAYARLLAEQGVDPRAVRSVADFTRLAPVLDKASTFGRFDLEDLCLPGTLAQLASVLTSSGQGGRFAFGLSTWRQQRRAADLIDLGLAQTFDTDRRRTLAINCLPMGVHFASRTVTVADTSVREDMAAALVARFGPAFQQIVLVTDPLFCKRLLDHADAAGLDWRRHRVHVVLGEETFGERFRAHVAARLGIALEDTDGGFVGSSLGVGELGLNLLFETRETVALRRRLATDPDLAAALLGPAAEPGCPPVLFAFNPLRTLVEAHAPGADGTGRLLVSMLADNEPLPLLRYDTGDRARVLERRALRELCTDLGLAAPRLPVVAVYGRAADVLPDGRSVLAFKDALYADPAVAAAVTGAFRLEWVDGAPAIHVQLRPGVEGADGLPARLAAVLPVGGAGAATLRLWPFREFPFGMNLDYERKFTYWAPPPAGA